MSSILPKEKQTAYQRWELASFDAPAPKPEAPPKQTATQAAEVTKELEKLRQQARQEGREAGLTEGREQGFQQGLNEGRAKAADEITRLKHITNSFQEEIGRANELIAQDLLAVSLDLAKAMLQTALKIRPELVLPIVNETVHYLPSVQAPASLFLHPDDLKIVKQFMGDELSKTGWRVMEDPHVQRGGCRVETPSNQIDATTETRWQRITAALGKSDEWLEK
jgi:flagellar assembly protein FliH